jgi:lipopolysaccharide export system ATP-binding protein
MTIATGHTPAGSAPLSPPPGSGLIVDRIGKSFRGRQVVKGVSLHLARGEVAGLLGPNGAGKTTCFYMITGLIAADYGAIWLDGEDITNQPMYQRARQGLGYLPQETSIFRGMTVEQNVMAVVEMREPPRQGARITNQLLEELHIDHLRTSPAVSALSGGERRRVEIARALASEPAFMLLDEPFAGIDPLAIADIREVIGYLRPGHRHPDHRPQRARDAGHHRPRLDHPRRRGAVRRLARRDPRRSRGAPGLSRRPPPSP